MTPGGAGGIPHEGGACFHVGGPVSLHVLHVCRFFGCHLSKEGSHQFDCHEPLPCVLMLQPSRFHTLDI